MATSDRLLVPTNRRRPCLVENRINSIGQEEALSRKGERPSRLLNNHFGTAELRGPVRPGQEENTAPQDRRARLAGRARRVKRGGNPIYPRRAFLACLALHTPRSLTDFFSILLEERYDFALQGQTEHQRIALSKIHVQFTPDPKLAGQVDPWLN